MGSCELFLTIYSNDQKIAVDIGGFKVNLREFLESLSPPDAL